MESELLGYQNRRERKEQLDDGIGYTFVSVSWLCLDAETSSAEGIAASKTSTSLSGLGRQVARFARQSALSTLSG
jgi:hypothetical protein